MNPLLVVLILLLGSVVFLRFFGEGGPFSIVFAIGLVVGLIGTLFLSMGLYTTRDYDISQMRKGRQLAKQYAAVRSGSPMDELTKAQVIVQVHEWNSWLIEAKYSNKSAWDWWHPDEVMLLREIE